LTNVKVARRATEEEEMLRAPPEKEILTVKKYANTHFVNVMVEKPFYTQLERMAEKLGTTPDVTSATPSSSCLKGLSEAKAPKPLETASHRRKASPLEPNARVKVKDENIMQKIATFKQSQNIIRFFQKFK
jgi:hypothetical protein